MELTDLNVNNVLNEIRPYIEADGGYLEFVSIDYLEEGPVVSVSYTHLTLPTILRV